MLCPVAAERNFQALVEIRHLFESLRQHAEVVGEVLENLVVGHKDDGSAGLAAAAPGERLGRQLGQPAPARKRLPVEQAVAADFHVKAFGERVDDRRADAVQPAGDGVRLAAELAARVQRGHHGLYGGHAGGRVDVHGDAAPVVFHAHRAVGQDVYRHARGETRHKLVHAVVHDFVDEVMQAALVGAADVHAGALADGLHALKHLNIAGGVHINFLNRCHSYS